MAAGDMAAQAEPRSDDDVLRALRTGTAEEHRQLEETLDLLDPELDRARLVQVLGLMHGFWTAAERGLDEWAARHPADAATAGWARRRRAGLFAADLAALGAPVPGAAPGLPAVPGTDEALGRLYVLEGSTLGGTFIDRHLAALPLLAGVRLHAFSPYGAETGAMWAAYRRVARAHVAAGGNADRVVAAARDAFRELSEWCRPAARAQAVGA
ncbi:biliverdin-producing heme oxygenase [Blastococcus sp. MG754426]|uniref:biliverdin-producing heme oxygenase n=2 Tax=unclassified Blastococcus TaxID=2619396 RepID=UPI001F16F0B7|nr:biliverdin-producing heme oxygenase [Blastococcus sp. MG754427]MCF6506894.1 biliverdin-producing heme oxygenase [Blastococcus sp. MG754426]MCF6511860.1 biliverdin-producing heme oxygenase [Blastococcus sp. MG754427]MCF6736785.1 biliverdin-producing heme oxygenase [Blastococcus sp. KM273129]